MPFDRTGIILYVLRYQECVEFYQHTLGLETLFTTPDLTCFEFGSSYLMVEVDDEYQLDKQDVFSRNRTCLRMNVPDVQEYAHKLQEANIQFDLQERSWGTVVKFFDPDGNLCAFKDSEKFEAQVRMHPG